MKASVLIGKLTEAILANGDGEVIFKPYDEVYESIDMVDIREDVDVNGKVTKRLFVLESY